MAATSPNRMVPTGPMRPGTWLLQTIAPWWCKHIVDPEGGYFEAVDPAGTAVRDSKRTTLTQARLTYVFSHAAILTGDGRMLQAARHGRAFLEERCRDDARGGWWRAVSIDGTVEDPAHDTYDHAFVLFALAWHFRATGDTTCKALAERTCAFMSKSLADPEHGGFVEEVGTKVRPAPIHRRQNPHMHLLEAYLAWHAADPNGPWLGYGAAIVALFERRFVDSATGTLIEYFNQDWTPATGPDGKLREPGHHFEWTWLLHQYQVAASLPQPPAAAAKLWTFGLSFGVERDIEPRDLAFDGVDAAGNLLAGTKLLWPQTELLKACATRVESAGDASARALAKSVYARMQEQFFYADGVRWMNQVTRAGVPLQPAAPSRILYHVFLALAELDRVMGPDFD